MPVLATKTLKAIDDAIAADGGAKYRSLLKKYLPMMDDAYRGEELPFRSHLGASTIGKECARELWYNFNWATKPSFSPRILRLFNRGHLEEARFIALLEAAGMKVYTGPESGGQFIIKGYRGHFGSALDGAGEDCPDVPGIPVLLEFKTSAEKGFKQVVNKGVQEVKWEHYVQMQIYMMAYKLTKALYLVVNKNNDDIHGEIVDYDHATAVRYNERAAKIVDATEPPLKISTIPSFFKCKFCDHSDVCHFDIPAERTCRSCIFSSITDDGGWLCRGECPLSKEDQHFACSSYQYNPIFNFPV